MRVAQATFSKAHVVLRDKNRISYKKFCSSSSTVLLAG